MRFSHAEAMCDPSFELPLAMAAEEAGYHGFVVHDNPGYLGPSKGKLLEYDGEHHRIDPVNNCPMPTQPIPSLIGGHSGPALRRAARLGDGWMHTGGSED